MPASLVFTSMKKWIALTLAMGILNACEMMTTPSSGTSSGGSPIVTSPVTSGTTTLVPTVLDAEESTFIGLINAYRAQSGAPALQVSATLRASSLWMSADMSSADYFDHTDSLGRDPYARMAAFGYVLIPVIGQIATSGENIAAGNASAQDTFTQWKNSPAHNANMLDAAYRVIGVGRAYGASSAYGWYWTTDFGSTVDAVISAAGR